MVAMILGNKPEPAQLSIEKNRPTSFSSIRLENIYAWTSMVESKPRILHRGPIGIYMNNNNNQSRSIRFDDITLDSVID